jgi:hypothetical protein
METLTYRRENYCKFNQVHDKFVEYLEDGISAKLTAKDLNISLPTYYKYKSIITIENNKIYKIKEETDFIEREQRKLKAKEEASWARNKEDIKNTTVKRSSATPKQPVKDENVTPISTQPVQASPDTKVSDKEKSL